MVHAFRILSIMAAVIAWCALLAVSPSSSFAATVEGVITDGGDGEALAGATIQFKAADMHAKTFMVAADKEGRFVMKNLPPGQYEITVSSIGFASETISEVAVSETDTKTLKVSLTPTSVNFKSVSVSASRRPEKILNAPAAVTVMESEEVENRTTLTPAEHIKGLAAVDVASTGLNQSTIVVRGFNNVFSGALLVLTDNRIARVPSLRFNAYNFIPTVNEDIERIEVVSGPGSALYGPNAADGVMHLITKSPFASQGTTISLGAGERNLFLGSFRHAGMVGNRIGYKITGQYYQGDDWKTHDPMEPDSIQKYRPTPEGPEPVGEVVVNERNFDIEKLAGEGRVDFLIANDMNLILNGGVNRASSIELTGLGAGQAIDWTYAFAQARWRYKDLFVQGFVNMSDAGETYLLSTGQLIIDKSKLWAAQIQHRYNATDKLSLTYGFDALFTRPETKGTINGNNENEDNIDELGVYLQADMILSRQFKIVGAARFDEHNRLEDPVFSPRAGLVYDLNDNHSFRATYNRAFSTPDNNNLYLDILATRDIAHLGTAFGIPEMNIRVQGVPESGFHWRIGDEGPYFHSVFAPLGGLATTDYIPYNDPLFTNVMWGAGRGAVMSVIQDQLALMVQAGMINQATADGVYNAIDAVTPDLVDGSVLNTLRTLNPDTQAYEPSDMSDIADIARLEPAITQTFELGYKGIVGDRLQLGINLYRSQKDNFIGPLTVETPNVFLDPASLQNYLATQYSSSVPGADPTDSAYLAALDAAIGNGDGNPIPELVEYFASGAAQIPFGTVTPDEAYDPTAVLVTYRNFGDINYYGADFSFAYHLNQNWNVGGMYSYITKNFFEKSNEQVHDIHLNAPRHKVGFTLQYINPQWGLNINSRYRFIDAFDMDSPFYGSSIKAYHIVDVNAGVHFFYGTDLNLTVQNVFDNRHVEFIGGPEIGRLAIMRLSRSFK